MGPSPTMAGHGGQHDRIPPELLADVRFIITDDLVELPWSRSG